MAFVSRTKKQQHMNTSLKMNKHLNSNEYQIFTQEDRYLSTRIYWQLQIISRSTKSSHQAETLTIRNQQSFPQTSITSSLEMACHTSQYNDPHVLQGDPQNNDSLTVFSPPEGQDSRSDFEHYFTNMYSFQTSVMSNLNRLDFRNLQLAGVRTPISQQIQQKYLIPSKCDEKLLIPGMNPVACPNNSKNVNEIKTCHGLHHDGWGRRGRQERWNEPTRLFKHVPKSDSLVQISDKNEGGHFDSFNVCVQCHDRDRARRRPYEVYTFNSFYTTMCQTHSMEHVRQQPYNVCRCKMFLDKYWRCQTCCLDTLDELKMRAQSFGDDPYPTFVFDKAAQMYVDSRTGGKRINGVCPILGCTGQPWRSGPKEKQMWMCRACTAIFPPADESAV